MKWGYISAQKPESERSKSFTVFFDCKTRPSRVSLASLGLENIPQIPVNRAKVGQNHDAPKALSATLLVFVKWGYISVQKLQSERSKSFRVCILVQTKAIKS